MHSENVMLTVSPINYLYFSCWFLALLIKIEYLVSAGKFVYPLVGLYPNLPEDTTSSITFCFQVIVKLYERKLIDDFENDVPKDYTIIFKFCGTIFQPILYIEIDVNVSVSLIFWLRAKTLIIESLLHQYSMLRYHHPSYQQYLSLNGKFEILERKHWWHERI